MSTQISVSIINKINDIANNYGMCSKCHNEKKIEIGKESVYLVCNSCASVMEFVYKDIDDDFRKT